MQKLVQFPDVIAAGLSRRVEFQSDIYPAPTWSVTAHFRGPSTADFAAVGNDLVHVFDLTSEQTGALISGLYDVSVRATDGASVVEIEAGRLEVTPDITQASAGHDPRGHAEKVLAAVEAVLEGRATKDQAAYSINGRSLTLTPIMDLLKLRDRYKREVADLRSNGANRALIRRQVKVRF